MEKAELRKCSAFSIQLFALAFIHDDFARVWNKVGEFIFRSKFFKSVGVRTAGLKRDGMFVVAPAITIS
jgi:hypothetical protein